MKNRKTLLIIPLLLLTSCNKPTTHTHEYGEYIYDDSSHYQECVLCNEQTEKELHNFSSWLTSIEPRCDREGEETRRCLTCGYTQARQTGYVSHKLSSSYEYDETYHYYVCETCGNEFNKSVHLFNTPYVNNTNQYVKDCYVCGYTVVIDNPTLTLNKFNGLEIDLSPEVTRNFVENKSNYDYLATSLCTDGYYVSNVGYDYQTNITLSFTTSGDYSPYKVEIALDEDFNEIFDEYETNDTSILTDGVFIPGNTYYWRVRNRLGIYSDIDTFKTKSGPVRWFDFGTVFNVRDLGGWKTIHGVDVKYGKIYRGGGVNDSGWSYLNDRSRHMFNKLGIKGELDLRSSSTNTTNTWNPSYPFLKVNGGWYYQILNDQTFINGMKESIHFLAQEENYPVYFHCSSGKDRTGTLAFIVNGLLGVSLDDLYVDFELSNFSDRVNEVVWRTQIDKDDEGDGYHYDFVNLTRDRCQMMNVIKNMTKNYGDSEDPSFSKTVERYLRNKVGVPIEDIENIKRIMLGDIDYHEHSWSDWIIDIEPTMDKEGSKHKVCEGCGEIVTSSIPKSIVSVNGENLTLDGDHITGISGGSITAVSDINGYNAYKLVARTDTADGQLMLSFATAYVSNKEKLTFSIFIPTDMNHQLAHNSNSSSGIGMLSIRYKGTKSGYIGVGDIDDKKVGSIAHIITKGQWCEVTVDLRNKATNNALNTFRFMIESLKNSDKETTIYLKDVMFYDNY